MRIFDETTLVHIRTELELDRTKLLAVGLLFLFFGITSVITQMFMPEILSLSGLEIVNVPDPSVEQVLVDFWGDVAILSMVIILFTMSTFSSELDIGKSGYFYHARPVSRRTYYLTRFFVRTGGIMVLFFVSSLLVYGYSILFFDPLDIVEISVSSALLALNIGAIAAVVVSLSSALPSTTSGGVGLITVFLQLMVGLVEPLKWLSPFSLAGIWEDIIFSTVDTSDLMAHSAALATWIAVPCILGLVHYTRRDLV